MSEVATAGLPAEQDSRKKDVFEGYDPSVKVRTKKMLMYLIIFAIVMLFGGLTSGYIVKHGGSFWVHVAPPSALYTSLVFLALSSATLFGALKLVKAGKQKPAAVLMFVTFALGIGFTATQYNGWQALAAKGMGVTVNDTASGMKKYSWNHIDEITGEYGTDYFVYVNGTANRLVLQNGEFYLPSDTLFTEPVTNELRAASNNASAFIFVLLFLHVLHLGFGLIYLIVNGVRILRNRIHITNTASLYANGMYWHFMGILWVYLFLFLFVFH